jgi:hypothetical protein
MSVETMGSSVYERIPFRSFSDASRKASFISSRVTSFLKFSTISVIDPLATGTRNAVPSILLFSSGIHLLP